MTESKALYQQAHESLMFFESELFKTVQMSGVFTDSKTFADAIPTAPFSEILNHYDIEKQSKYDFGLKKFIEKYFEIPVYTDVSIDGKKLCIQEHIEALWQCLTKNADVDHNTGSLLPLKRSYIVPGGRFREIYYWDSYFTSLGLLESGQEALVDSIMSNFLDLQNRYGCIPNGNRSYYLSRSQPPILGLMVDLVLPLKQNEKQFIAEHIEGIESEYKFWMRGQELLSDENSEHMRVVKMPDGSFLNRYWDESCSPRPESYREDIELLHESNAKNPDVFFRNIRAACESGWDFSSRWLADDLLLSSIRTTRILPIDLNCLLYKQEKLLSHYYAVLGDDERSLTYRNFSTTRKSAINRYSWSEEHGFFMDYDLDTQAISPVKSLAGALPLFVELATSKQAKQVSIIIEKQFLQKGGVITTLIKSSQQWDSPNGWAPLHWFTAQGLLKYNNQILADEIINRWLSTVKNYYDKTGKIMEKYNVCQQATIAEGGEYDVQEGFGWTNGVYQAFNSYLKNNSNK
ncbi:MAG: alpha,alpha-trehalase [Alteromonadaceae bacterium]|jgi:alpha,alpha-trehalase